MPDQTHILIVDDDEGVRESLAFILEDEGYAVAGVGTGAEALAHLAEKPCQVALVDIRLPDMDGLDLLAALKGRDPTMAVVVISAYATLENAVQSLNRGADAYIVKPFHPDEAKAVIRKAIEKQRLVADNLRLLEETQRRNRELSVLYTIDRAAAHSLELAEVLTDAVESTLEALEIEAGGIFLLEPDGETMTLRVHQGLSEEFVEAVRHIRLGEGISGRAAAEGRPLVLDVADYPTERLAPHVIKEGFQTLASTPLLSAGKVLGALNLGTRRPRAFPPQELDLLAAVGQHLGQAVQNARLHQDTQQTRDYLQSVLDSSIDLIFTVKPDGTFGYFNPRLTDVTGYQAEAIHGRPFMDFIPEDRRAFMLQKWQEITQGIGSTYETEIIAADSRRIPVLVSHSAIEGFDEYLAVLRDISGLKAAERELRQRAEEMTSLYVVGMATSSSLELEQVLRSIHEQIERMVDFDGFYIALYDEEKEELRFEIIIDEGQPLPRFSRRLDEGGGLTAWIVRSGQALLVRDMEQERESLPVEPQQVGTAVRSWLGIPMIVRDKVVGVISVQNYRPHVFSEDQQRLLSTMATQAAIAIDNARLYQKVLASEQEYRTLVENATDLIWTLDTEGRFAYVNRQAEEVSGYKAEDWVGKSFAPLIAPPEDLPRIQQVFLETLSGKAQSYEVGVYRADGSLFYLAVNTAPLYREGKLVGTISFGRDVTAEKEAEAALQRRLTELSALFEVSGALRDAATVEEMLPIILEETIKVVSADTGAIFLVDELSGELVASATYGRLEALRGLRLAPTEEICVCGHVAQTCDPYLFADLASDPYTGTRLQASVEGVQGGVCVPLMVGSLLVGTLIISSYTPRTFTRDEFRLLIAIADMAASAIHRAGLFEELQARVSELTTVYQMGQMITATLRIEDMLDFIVSAASETLQAEASYLFLWDEREERLVMRAVQGLSPELVGQLKYRLGEGLSGWVFLEGRPANVPDAAADPRWKREPSRGDLRSGLAISALVVPLAMGTKTLGVLGVINKTVDGDRPKVVPFTSTDESLLTALAGQVAIAIENARLYEDVRDLSIATIRSLATAIDARDPYTKGHSDQVAGLSVLLAQELGWMGTDLEMLEFAALLHDVGKIGIPDAVLKKIDPLTPEDWNCIYLHPYHSAQMVKPVEPLQRIIPWIYHHQERWDGTGYPDRLKGEDIPLGARIIAVADAYNAMTTDRPYRKARSREEAVEEVRRCAGTQFDPQVVEVFVRLLEEELTRSVNRFLDPSEPCQTM